MSDVDDPTMDAYAALWNEYFDAEMHSEMLRCVGFYWWPNNALEFIRRYIAAVAGGEPWELPDRTPRRNLVTQMHETIRRIRNA